MLSNPKKILSSKAAILALVVLLAFLANMKYRQYRGEREIENLKRDLEAQAEAQQRKNEELKNSISYLNSGDFKEKVAREQLNLKKEGEVVYNFTEAPAPETKTSSQIQADNLSNPGRWWYYFFPNTP